MNNKQFSVRLSSLLVCWKHSVVSRKICHLANASVSIVSAIAPSWPTGPSACPPELINVCVAPSMHGSDNEAPEDIGELTD